MYTCTMPTLVCTYLHCAYTCLHLSYTYLTLCLHCAYTVPALCLHCACTVLALACTDCIVSTFVCTYTHEFLRHCHELQHREVEKTFGATENSTALCTHAALAQP